MSLSCCMMKLLPISLDAFFCKLPDKMVLWTPELILLLLSWDTSSVKTSEPFQTQPWKPKPGHYLHHASQMSLYVLDHKQILSFSILWPFNHFGGRLSWSHRFIKICSKTFVSYSSFKLRPKSLQYTTKIQELRNWPCCSNISGGDWIHESLLSSFQGHGVMLEIVK